MLHLDPGEENQTSVGSHTLTEAVALIFAVLV